MHVDVASIMSSDDNTSDRFDETSIDARRRARRSMEVRPRPPPVEIDLTAARAQEHSLVRLKSLTQVTICNIIWYLCFAYQKNLGNCDRCANLPALPQKKPAVVKKRKANVPLPTAVLQPANIPNAPVGIALAVDPTGMNFPDWLTEVENAYQTNPGQYPQLTPGQSCFWDCVAPLSGTAHMWYSWYMAGFSLQPDPNDPVVGNVTMADTSHFCCERYW